MAVYAVISDVQGHSPAKFLVEADSSASALGMLRAWLEGHARVSTHAGEWVDSADVSPVMHAGRVPVRTDELVESSGDAFTIDGLRLGEAVR